MSFPIPLVAFLLALSRSLSLSLFLSPQQWQISGHYHFSGDDAHAQLLLLPIHPPPLNEECAAFVTLDDGQLKSTK
jgi:hypothetical protein